MNSYIRRLTYLGVYSESDYIERRRIWLLNVFALLAFAILLIFTSINLVAGDWKHALTIFSGELILVFPVMLLSYQRKTQVARLYFVLSTLIFINFTGYISLFNFENRGNEFSLIGFGTLVIVLFDNPIKTVVFLLTASSAIAMKLIRFHIDGVDILVEQVISLTNLSLSFFCVFFLTSAFKYDLMKSKDRIAKFASSVKYQKSKISAQNDEIQINRSMLRATIDNIPVFIATLDTEGKFLIVNPKFQEAFSVTEESMEGKHYGEVFKDKLYEEIKPLFHRCLNGKASDINGSLITVSGEKVHVFGKHLPVTNDNNEVTGVLIYVVDVSQLKSTELELKELNNIKDKMLSILSHDLKSPLNSLSGILDISENIGKEQFGKMLGNLKYQVDTLLFTLDNLLIWVKTQLEGFKATQVRTDVSHIITSSLALYESELKKKEIILTNEITSDTFATVDGDNLALVMRNLISNAIKFTKVKGSVRISSLTTTGHLQVMVKDTGIGISENIIKSILDGTNRANPKTMLGTEGEKGTGLGLAFSIDMLTQNDAKIKIESNDEGTEVTLILLA